MADSPEALFAAQMSADAARPFVTYYDEGTGERAELSVRSLANWVAKTHFLLTDELGLGVGDAAYVNVPADWISVPMLLGCWTAGLEIVTSPAAAAVAFATGPVDGVADVYVAAPGTLPRSSPAAPAATADYVTAVRPQPDKWPTVHFPAGPADPALDGVSRADLVAKARARAEELALSAGARVITAREWRSSAEWIDTLLAPLTVGGSLVIVRGASPETMQRRAEQERATTVV